MPMTDENNLKLVSRIYAIYSPKAEDIVINILFDIDCKSREVISNLTKSDRIHLASGEVNSFSLSDKRLVYFRNHEADFNTYMGKAIVYDRREPKN